MTNAEKLTLAKHACHIRMGVIEGTHSAKCGHPGGSLDIAELLSYLYFVEMNIDPKDPKKADRDRLVLSKGHAAPALYAALAERGYFPVEDLKTLRKIGSYLQGHPNMNETPGVDMSTGSLGQGISAACGMALGAKHAGKPINVFAIVGDGEVEEGEVLGGLYVCRPLRPEQPVRVPGPQPPADRRLHRDGHEQRAAGREDEGLQLQRADHQWPRL